MARRGTHLPYALPVPAMDPKWCGVCGHSGSHAPGDGSVRGTAGTATSAIAAGPTDRTTTGRHTTHDRGAAPSMPGVGRIVVGSDVRRNGVAADDGIHLGRPVPTGSLRPEIAGRRRGSLGHRVSCSRVQRHHLWIIRRQGQLGAGLVHNDLITERAWERLRRDPSMPQRWELVADRLDAGEAIQFDTLAKWRELGAGHEEPEAEGFLVLTDRRLLFATFALGCPPRRADFADHERVGHPPEGEGGAPRSGDG